MVLIYNLVISTHIGYHTSNHHGKFTAYEQYWISRVKSLAFISYWTDISYLKWSFWLKCFEWPLMLQLFQLKQKSTSQDYKSCLSHFSWKNSKSKVPWFTPPSWSIIIGSIGPDSSSTCCSMPFTVVSQKNSFTLTSEIVHEIFSTLKLVTF